MKVIIGHRYSWYWADRLQGGGQRWRWRRWCGTRWWWRYLFAGLIGLLLLLLLFTMFRFLCHQSALVQNVRNGNRSKMVFNGTVSHLVSCTRLAHPHHRHTWSVLTDEMRQRWRPRTFASTIDEAGSSPNYDAFQCYWYVVCYVCTLQCMVIYFFAVLARRWNWESERKCERV